MVLGVLLLAGYESRAQDLQGEWTRIQAEFLSGMHDSVVVHIRPFIAELEQRDLKPQLSVALFHYAVSLAQTGSIEESDLAFRRAKEAARASGLTDKVTEIGEKQAQMYLALGRKMEEADTSRALQYYAKAVDALTSPGNKPMLGAVHYHRGILYRSMGDTPRAIADFEAALGEISVEEAQLRTSLISLLTESYVAAGQSEKARQLSAGTLAGGNRLEYVIKLASEAEEGRDYGKADQLLASIQDEVFREYDPERVGEFVKKRYSLAEQRNTRSGRDTLLAMIESSRKQASPAVRFRLHYFAAQVSVQAGDVSEAGRQVDRMKQTLDGGTFSPDDEFILARILGDVAYLQGDTKTAIASYQKALASPGSFEKEVHLSMSNNLGLALTREGRDEEALTQLDLVSQEAQRDGLSEYAIQADLNSGIVLIKLDREKEATERLIRAKTAADESGNVTLRVMASLRLAEVYRRGGYEKLADEMFDEVRLDQRRLTNPMNKIQVLQALAANAKIRGNKYMALLNLRQAHELTRQIGALGYEASLTIDLADTYFLVDSLESAKAMYRHVISLYGGTSELGVVVEQYYKLGQCYLTISQFDSARAEIEKGLALLLKQRTKDYSAVPLESVRDPDLYGQGLANLGFSDLTEGRQKQDIRKLLASLKEVQRSVEVLERRKGLGVTQTQKESQQLKNVNAYRLLVDVSSAVYEMTEDPRYCEMAFNTSEKSRAEGFVTDIGSQLITKINDPNVRELSRIAAQLAEERDQETSPASLDLTSPEQTRGLKITGGEKKRGDEKTLSQYETIVRRLNAQNNKAAQLVSVNTMNLRSVQSILTPSEALLSYYVSIDKVYLFAVTSAMISMHSIHWTPEEVSGKVEAFRSAVHDLERMDYRLLGRELFDSLVAPVESRIAGKKLIIVPSGRLNNLPFAGLMKENQFLAEVYDCVVLPNASTLQFVRTEAKFPSAPRVIAVGNPVNPRVTRLPGTEREVTNIGAIYPGSSVLLAGRATETNCRNEMASFDIVHIACHGLFNDNYPLLSSLVLSPDAHNDGFLEVHELYNLNLTKTRLVILSACETGLSQIKKNDDVIGLVRGFLYAGVPSLVASLWKVDDNATAALMSNFHLLLKLGNSKGEALRKAQLQLMRNEATRHPYFWAAFVLYGNPD